MLVVRIAGLAAVTGLIVLTCTVGSSAQEKKAAPSNPVGGNWSATAAADPAASAELSPAQAEIVKQVSSYFNGLQTLKGSFAQTDPDNKRTRGKFFVKRPGKFRFDYGSASKKVVISDGKMLAIQDQDLANEDLVELDNTPFRILLRKDVDLVRDATVLEAQEADDVLTVTVQDKSPDAPGRIQLFLMRKPKPELKEWVITDAQGLRTRVEVSEVVLNEPIEDSTFQRENMAAKRLQR
jgi:outer membrane lipoprotein-sorting protein